MRATGHPEMQRVHFANPDINYMFRRHDCNPRFVGRMLRIFGERTVLETLRRYSPEWGEGVFYRICQEVEREAQA